MIMSSKKREQLEFPIMKYMPPDYTKRIEECKFRGRDGICCNARNYLRPYKCSKYNVEKLDQWLHEAYPQYDEEIIVKIVKKITQHEI